MKRATILLGTKRTKKVKDASVAVQSANGGPADMDEDEWDLQYDLLRGDQVVIVDDTNAYQFFGDSIFTAPQEDLLEGWGVLNIFA